MKNDITQTYYECSSAEKTLAVCFFY